MTILKIIYIIYPHFSENVVVFCSMKRLNNDNNNNKKAPIFKVVFPVCDIEIKSYRIIIAK